MAKGPQTDTVTLVSIPESSWVASNSLAVPINANRTMRLQVREWRSKGFANMVIDLRARSGGSEVHRIRQGRSLVAEIGTRNDRAGSDGGRKVHACRNTHKSDAYGSRHCRLAADAKGNDSADQSRGGINGRAKKLEPVVDHCDYGAAESPGAD